MKVAAVNGPGDLRLDDVQQPTVDALAKLVVEETNASWLQAGNFIDAPLAAVPQGSAVTNGWR